jgi:hypothetical protein
MTSDRSIEQDSEMMRLQILGDPQLMAQLQEVYRPCFPVIFRFFIFPIGATGIGSSCAIESSAFRRTLEAHAREAL